MKICKELRFTNYGSPNCYIAYFTVFSPYFIGCEIKNLKKYIYTQGFFLFSFFLIIYFSYIKLKLKKK